jgi:hypothetical protein
MLFTMHKWNTIKVVSTNKLDQATAILETLESPANAAILAYVQENGKAQLLDLALHVQANAHELERQLDRLCQCRLLLRREEVVGCYYTLNELQLRKAKHIATVLSGFYQA